VKSLTLQAVLHDFIGFS